MVKLNQITNKLIKAGLRSDTPSALIRWGSEPHQTTITGTIENISRIYRASINRGRMAEAVLKSVEKQSNPYPKPF